MTDETEHMEDLFGPRARYSEYRVGQTIRYRADGMVKTGEISWVTAPGRTALGTEHPTEYWVGLDCIYQSDIAGLDEVVESALLVPCPYCGTTHAPEAVEYCRKKRGT